MRPEVQSKVNEVIEKWDGFLAKVNARIDEVLAEADAGIDQLMEQHAQDYGPMGAAFSAIQSRFHGLGTKVTDAFEKIREELHEVTELDRLTPEEWALISSAPEASSEKYRQMQDHIELSHYTIEMQKSADWARRLRSIADEEIARGVPCSECGAKIRVETLATSTQQKCASCGAVNEVTPGMAAASFYLGNGVHALAHEQAWNLWLAERKAKEELYAKHYPTAHDERLYHEAAHEYWTAYYQAGLDIYPGFTKDVASAVDAKMKQYTAWDHEKGRRSSARLLPSAALLVDEARIGAGPELAFHGFDHLVGHVLVRGWAFALGLGGQGPVTERLHRFAHQSSGEDGGGVAELLVGVAAVHFDRAAAYDGTGVDAGLDEVTGAADGLVPVDRPRHRRRAPHLGQQTRV